MTASRAVRIATGWKARRRTGAAASGLGTADVVATGTRRTVPHPQPSSGYGHWLSRPQSAHRTVTHSSSQARWATAVAVPCPSSAGATGAPHTHG